RHTLTVPLDSTAPAPPAGASRKPLAPGLGTLAVIRSWQFIPTGKRTIRTLDTARFTVYFVGYSSALFGEGRLFLSSSPSEVEGSWFVQGFRNGNSRDGVIVPEGNTGVYTAPRCEPPVNPVAVFATIANKGFFSPPYRPRGGASLRIVPRDWLLSVNWLIDYRCVGSQDISDNLQYNANFQFTIDSDLHL